MASEVLDKLVVVVQKFRCADAGLVVIAIRGIDDRE